MKKSIRMNLYFYRVILLLFIVGYSFGQTYNKPGSTSAQFLKIGPSARYEALGEAANAFVDDASATFYNPSGMMNIQNYSLVCSYTKLPAAINLSFLSGIKRIDEYNSIGASIIMLRSDDMPIRTILQPFGTGESFHVADYAFGLHYGRNYSANLKFGFTFRYLYLNMVSGVSSVQSWSSDMGIQYNTGMTGILSDLTIGMVVSNFGPEITYINESYGLPLRYTVGVSKLMKIDTENKLLIGLNWAKSIDEKQRALAGMEYTYSGFLSIRAGYKSGSDSESWSAGIGVSQTISGFPLRFDYSLNDFGDLGAIHRISATVGL